jgi:hypothetical protein
MFLKAFHFQYLAQRCELMLKLKKNISKTFDSNSLAASYNARCFEQVLKENISKTFDSNSLAALCNARCFEQVLKEIES